MRVNATEEVACESCRETITLREYVGLEGGWYTDHRCTLFGAGHSQIGIARNIGWAIAQIFTKHGDLLEGAGEA